MGKRKFSEEQIINVLKESEKGKKTVDICRECGISDVTFYRWKEKYSGLSVNELRRLKQLEEENRRLKKLVAEQALDIMILKDVNEKNF